MTLFFLNEKKSTFEEMDSKTLEQLSDSELILYADKYIERNS